ncbi:MAG: TetR/AcrR family transcriptional regulator [Psychromonas sp.]|nr:TetR/AcrR family transcriptional regulator [Psychromonas sp.]
MNKKQQIIKTAFILFYQKGIHDVGINEIIHCANVAKKTLYNHFTSKDALILETIEYHHQEFIGWLVSRIKQGETSKDELLIIFEALDDWFNNRVEGFESFRGCYFNHCCAEYSGDTNPIFIASKQHKDVFKGIIHDNVHSFEINKEKALYLTANIFLLSEGAINCALVQKDKQSAKKAMQGVEHLLRFKR